MNWNELKKENIESIVDYINNQLEENNYNFTKVAKELGISESTVRKYITGRGYTRVNNLCYEYTGKKNDKCNLRGNTLKNNIEKVDDDSSMTDVINMADMKENLLYLNSEAETIKNIIQWFKSKDDNSITGVIELKEGIKIDLPEANIKRTTIRINEKVWDMFDEFVESNRPYEKHTLMAQALKEFMEKHS